MLQALVEAFNISFLSKIKPRRCLLFTVSIGSPRDSEISLKVKWSLWRRKSTMRYLGDNFSIAFASISPISFRSKSSWGSGEGSTSFSESTFSPSAFSPPKADPPLAENSENGMVLFFLRKLMAAFLAILKIQVLKVYHRGLTPSNRMREFLLFFK